MKNWQNEKLTPKERAKALLGEMSLDEKMAQLGCVFPFGENAQDFDWISAQVPFGIGQVSTLEMRRIETLEDCAAWQRRVQGIVMENSPHHIPAIFHMEGLCGAFLQDSTSFPSGIARGAGWDPELEEEIARTVSRQEAACGITQIFAPVLDVTRDPRMGRQGESYGEDPTLAAALGAAYTRGIQSIETAGRRPESVAKHFLAFHNSQGGIHGTHSDTPPRLLREIYAKPFQAAINAGLKGIMPCYDSLNGEPVSASKELLTGLLREEMGFDGLCVSDYGAVGNAHSVQHIGESFAEAGYRCMEAGMDMELPSTTGWNEELKAMFQSGEADITVLDRAVLRVLEAKFRMGLFEHPYALQGEELREAFSDSAEREISLRSARESLVLLKNDGALPLKKTVKKIALIGPHADCARKFFGGYTHLCMMESTLAVANSIAGVSGVVTDGRPIQTVPGTNIQSDEGEDFDAILRRQKPDCRSLLEELRARLPEAEITYAYGYPIAGADESGFEEALAAAKNADVVILTLGGKHGTCSMASMGEGVDASNINLPTCQDAFIREVSKLGKPLIGVHFDGRPISSDTADECLNAILEAWSPAECGAQAVTDALLGDCNPGGKLPVSVAYHAGQIPIYYNHPYGSAWHQGESIGFVNYVDLPHTPRYFFGHGLSYTSFAYSDLFLSAQEVDADGSLQIACTVENTGEIPGDEVVQLYLRDEYASMTRPVKELAGFCRVTLQPGEKKRVSFDVSPSFLAFLDRDMRWKIEKGAVEVQIGSSSEDIRLTGRFLIRTDAWIDGKSRSLVCTPGVGA
ncbi:MAG: glycoside hydrolase family 3 C-terminal domain-containing protein [Oscillospiraceae bacterium]|nr:glycoside hydrolase family 3 C-terminal domain-containing protein [Oscillospiraceae bacterium]